MHSTLDVVLKLNEDSENIKNTIEKCDELPLGEWEVLFNEVSGKGILYVWSTTLLINSKQIIKKFV